MIIDHWSLVIGHWSATYSEFLTLTERHPGQRRGPSVHPRARGNPFVTPQALAWVPDQPEHLSLPLVGLSAQRGVPLVTSVPLVAIPPRASAVSGPAPPVSDADDAEPRCSSGEGEGSVVGGDDQAGVPGFAPEHRGGQVNRVQGPKDGGQWLGCGAEDGGGDGRARGGIPPQPGGSPLPPRYGPTPRAAPVDRAGANAPRATEPRHPPRAGAEAAAARPGGRETPRIGHAR